jgi:hypothetical protein
LLEALSVDIHSLKIQFNKTPRAVVWMSPMETT